MSEADHGANKLAESTGGFGHGQARARWRFARAVAGLTGHGTRRPASRLALTLTMCALASTAGLLASPEAAFAGTDGQQVAFQLDCGSKSCPAGLDAVRITGKNQNGHSATWTGSGDGGVRIETKGWWWVGNIKIYYNVNHKPGAESPVDAWVPKSNNSGFEYAPDHGGLSNNWVVVGNTMATFYYGSTQYDGGENYLGDTWIPISHGASINCASQGDPTGQYILFTKDTGYYGIGWNDNTVYWGLLGPGFAPVIVLDGPYYYQYCD